MKRMKSIFGHEIQISSKPDNCFVSTYVHSSILANLMGLSNDLTFTTLTAMVRIAILAPWGHTTCTITNLMKFCLRTVGGIILINLQDTHASYLKDYTNQLSGDFIESSRAVNTSGNQNIAPRRHTLTPLWTRLFKVISKHSKNLRNFQNLTLSSRFLASFPISSWELKYSWVHACIWK